MSAFKENAIRPVSLLPIWNVAEEKLEEATSLVGQAVEIAGGEPECLDFTLAINGNKLFLRELFTDAAAVEFHLKCVSSVVASLRSIASLDSIIVMGPQDQLDLLKETLAPFKPVLTLFSTQNGFRR